VKNAVKPIAAYNAELFPPKLPIIMAKELLNKKTIIYHFFEILPVSKNYIYYPKFLGLTAYRISSAIRII
jgi:hypothetical protein